MKPLKSQQNQEIAKSANKRYKIVIYVFYSVLIELNPVYFDFKYILLTNAKFQKSTCMT